MAIPREARRIAYSTDIRNRKRIELDEYQKAIIVGTILGDACLHENWSKTNSRLQIRHSIAQKEYVLWKYEALKSLVLTAPQHYGRTNSVWFRTISHPDLTKLQQIFYRDGKKIIPKNIKQFLKSPLTMAVWFMDDGNARRDKGRLCSYNINTQSFTATENSILQKELKKIWNIETNLHSNHGYQRLYIKSQSVKRFTEIIKPHVLPSLSYKISSIGDSSSPVETGVLQLAEQR